MVKRSLCVVVSWRRTASGSSDAGWWTPHTGRFTLTRVSATQVPLSGMAAALIGLAAFAVVVLNFFWELAQYGMVMAHEGGHAAVSAMLFRKVDGIQLNANGTGSTRCADAGWLGNILISFTGYLGPSLFGLAAAKLIELGHIVTVLWLTLFLLVLLLLVVRTAFGVLAVVVAGGLVFLIVRYAPLSAQIVAAYAIAWFLLLSGVRRILERGVDTDDGQALSGMTFIPRFIWFLLWLAGTVTAVAAGGKWLVMRS
jgi:Peptidase M50B-like